MKNPMPDMKPRAVVSSASARKLTFGMVGGGRGAFIGAVHRIAAQMDGQAVLVAGALSSDGARALASAGDLFISPERAYRNYREMAEREAARPAGQRLDFVIIVTPNHAHFGPACCFLEAGFNVIIDKPVAFSGDEAARLAAIVKRTKKVFVLTHNYTGTEMVKQARALVRSGKLGAIRKVLAEYNQGWLSTALEKGEHKQAGWRTDPARSGASGCMGDIGTHAANLIWYITGLEIERLRADLTIFVSGRKLDDDGTVLLRFRDGAKGFLHASQICIGEENALSIRVYGTRASLEWHQERPQDLVIKYPDRPRETMRPGNGYVAPQPRSFSRVPPGHPEGYLEAFANIYREAFRAIRCEVDGRRLPLHLDFPTIDDGIRGMDFIQAVVDSSRGDAKWVKLPRR